MIYSEPTRLVPLLFCDGSYDSDPLAKRLGGTRHKSAAIWGMSAKICKVPSNYQRQTFMQVIEIIFYSS